MICANCGSDKVLEMSGREKIDWSAGRIKYGLGLHRHCTECNNSDFIIMRTVLV